MNTIAASVSSFCGSLNWVWPVQTGPFSLNFNSRESGYNRSVGQVNSIGKTSGSSSFSFVSILREVYSTFPFLSSDWIKSTSEETVFGAQVPP